MEINPLSFGPGARRSLFSFVLAGVGSLLAAGCPMADDGQNDDAGRAGVGGASGKAGAGAGGSGGGAKATMTGSVTRTVEAAPGNDAKGLLIVGALDVCSNEGANVLSSFATTVDFSGAAPSASFTLTGLPRTTVYLVGLLDDNGNVNPAAPAPDAGDLVYGFNAIDGLLDCVSVDLTNGDVADASLPLNLVEQDDVPAP